jgi:hypothetical protein
MCLPDFQPSFNMMTSGLRNLGLGMDNWINVVAIIAQKTVGLQNIPTCDELALGMGPADYSKELFGTSQPTVVGMTEGLYAVTDGTHAQYYSSYNVLQSITAPNIWPIPIDVRHGVAAVVYSKFATERDEMGNSRTTMLGCQCSDNAGSPPIRIVCGLALKGIESYGGTLNITEDLTFEVSFQQQSTAQYLTCNTVEISVQSVRWSSTRFTGSYDARDTTDNTCQSKNTCSAIDATVY